MDDENGVDNEVASTIDRAMTALHDQGWVVLSDLLDDAAIDAAEAEIRHLLVDTPTGRDSFEGFDTQRIYALAGKTRTVDPMLTHPVLTGICEQVLGQGFRALPPDRTKDVSDEVLEILGYGVTPPFLGYVDARDPLRHLTRQGYRD